MRETATGDGPILLEEEMLHDGEPVFGWVWRDGPADPLPTEPDTLENDQ